MSSSENSTQALRVARRRAFVTGGAKGIGAGIARRLAADRTYVVIADIDLAAALALAAEIGGQDAIGVQLDVTNIGRVREVMLAHGPFDILVNNAGVDQHAFFTETSPEDWRALLSINLESVFATTHVALPSMRAAGFGRIINIASEAGRMGSRGGSVYAAAKAGVIGFSRSIARENATRGITVNAIAPGPIDTPMLRAGLQLGGERLLKAMTGATLVGRLGTVDEVAAAVAFLASDAAGFITGEVLGVSGGMGCGQ